MNALNGGPMFFVIKIHKPARSLFFHVVFFLHFFFVFWCSPLVLSAEHGDIFVSAKKAEQQEDMGRYVLEGNVFIIFDSWIIKGQRGYLKGPLDNPIFINVSGEPVSLMREKNEDGGAFYGFGRNARLDLSSRVVNLEGDGSLNLGNRTVSSDSITYSIDKNLFSTQGRARVRVSSTSSEED